MNPFFEKINNLKTDVQLRPERKYALRKELAHFMAAAEVSGVAAPRRSWRGTLQTLFVKPAPIVIILGLLSGSGISYASQWAVPGEILYPIKIASEATRSAIAFSEKTKATVEAQRAERRLAEAEALAIEKKLTPEFKASLAQRFESHNKKTVEHIELLAAQGDVADATDASVQFETRLKTHEALMAELTGEGRFGNRLEKSEESLIRNRVTASIAEVSSLRIALENKINSSIAARLNLDERKNKRVLPKEKKSADKKLNIANQVITSARSYANEEEQNLDASIFAAIDQKITAAENLAADARAQFSAGAEGYGPAFNLGNAAIQSAQEARGALRNELWLQTKLNADEREEAKEKKNDQDADQGAGQLQTNPAGEMQAQIDASIQAQKTETSTAKANGEPAVELKSDGQGEIKLLNGL